MTTIAGPTSPALTSDVETNGAVVYPRAENGKSNTETRLQTQNQPEQQGSSEIKWREVLGESAEGAKVRERRERREAIVSPETLARIESGLIEAALVYGRAIGQDGQVKLNKVGFFIFNRRCLEIN